MANATPSPGAITLDELIALNEEIVALARAGVPIEHGLAELGGDMPGRLGRFAKTIAQRTGAGESLAEVVREHARELPPVYLAVIEVGLRTGRLPAALETLAAAIRRVSETRRCVTAAFLYPLSVVALAWLFFAFFAHRLAGSLKTGFDLMEVPGGGFFGALAGLGKSAFWWGPAVPLILAILAIVWWYQATRATIAEPRWAGQLFGWLPWLGSTLRLSRAATFADVLALLVENRVPLDEGIVMAADTCGDRKLTLAAGRVAAGLRRGETIQEKFPAFPPLLSWMIGAGGRSEALLPALKHAAKTYRRRAEYQAKMARVFLPVLAMLLIAGGIVLLYTLILFLPYASMLRALSRPV